MKIMTRKLLLLVEAFANSANGFFTSIIILSLASSDVFASFTLLGTAILAAKIFFQYLIINQFNLSDFQVNAEIYDTIYRFSIYTIICIVFVSIIEYLIILFTIGETNFALTIFIILELTYIFLRSIELKFLKYDLVLVSSISKTIISVILLFYYIHRDSNITQVFVYLSMSSLIAVMILLRNFKYNYCRINIELIKVDFLNSGRYQLPTGVVSWAKSSTPLFVINLLLGEEKLIVFRTLQIIFAPISLAFSIFESFLPQALARERCVLKGKQVLHNHVLKAMVYAPPILIMYFITLYSLENFISFSIMDPISTSHILVYSLFVFMIPFNAILQIGLRYVKQAKSILIINSFEIIILIAAMSLIANYFNFFAVLLYICLASFFVNVLYALRLYKYT